MEDLKMVFAIAAEARENALAEVITKLRALQRWECRTRAYETGFVCEQDKEGDFVLWEDIEELIDSLGAEKPLINNTEKGKESAIPTNL